MENEFLCFVKNIGTDIDENYIYEFLFTDDIETFFCENGEYKPCCLCNDIAPIENSYNKVIQIKTNIKLDLAQESCCYSISDCIDGIIPVAYENIDTYEEYPEPIRLIFHYGISYEEVEEQLAQRGILIEKKDGE